MRTPGSSPNRERREDGPHLVGASRCPVPETEPRTRCSSGVEECVQALRTESGGTWKSRARREEAGAWGAAWSLRMPLCPHRPAVGMANEAPVAELSIPRLGSAPHHAAFIFCSMDSRLLAPSGASLQSGHSALQQVPRSESENMSALRSWECSNRQTGSTSAVTFWMGG